MLAIPAIIVNGMDQNYGAMLLRWKPALVQVSQTSAFQDYSAGFFMLEELVAAGASKIVTDHDIFTTQQALLRLPDPIRKRLEIVRSSESYLMALAVMRPVLNELGLEGTEYGSVQTFRTTRHSESLRHDAVNVYFALPDFFLACREQLQLDFPLQAVQTAITRLRSEVREPAGRASLATLSGIFSSYRPAAVDGLVTRSDMPQESAAVFLEILEDEVFREMSAAGWLMGIPAKIDQAIVSFQRCAHRIVESRLFKPLTNLASKGISTATHIPMPDSEIGSLIAKKGYMPPHCCPAIR